MKSKETHASKRRLPMESMDSKYQWREVEWGGLHVSFQKALDDVDFAPLLRREPNGQCQCQHWGFILKGKMFVRYEDREETINASEAYYIAPGHIPFVTKGTELLELTPQTEIEKTTGAAMKNLQMLKAKKKLGTKKDRRS